jgi:hypothetical protein
MPEVGIVCPPAEGIFDDYRSDDQHLVAEAATRLREEGVVAPARIVARLEQLAAEARTDTTGRGLAIFASQAVARRTRLPISVAPRAVVEPTFATRDLMRALHRTPPYLLLVLHPSCAHLYDGSGGRLTPLPEHGFPFDRTMDESDVVGTVDAVASFLAQVDAAFGALRAERPCPFVLAGPKELTARFVDLSQHLYRLAGVVTGVESTSLTDLYVEARASVERYLLSREAEALWTLDHALATCPERVATGLDASWTAARATSRAMLVVEEGFAAPSADRHDLVDDLIEKVIERGGWVAFTRDGMLEHQGRVALVLGRT